MHDLRHAVRSLAKSPGFTAVALLALALGIGANTAIFSVVYGVLLRPLPFPEQERLLFIGEWSEQVPNMSVSYPNFLDWRARQRTLTALGVARSQGFSYVGPAETERLVGAMASHDLFAALGVAPIRGRLFSADEDKVGAERTALIGEALWQRLFGGRETIVGEKIQLSGNFHTIVGVMPAAFQYPSRGAEVWIPVGLSGDAFADRGNHPGLYAVGRLKPGISLEAGTADLKGIAEQLAREYPQSNARQSASVQRFTDRAFGGIRTALYVLLGAAGFVLLIACANVANLQLARAHARRREFAVRAALGAGRGRVIRLLLVESLLLGGLGCAGGVLLGLWGIDLLRSILPANVPRLAEVSLNGYVLAFAVAASLLTSVAFGLVPALQAARLNLTDALAQGARAGGGATSHRWRSSLIVGEFALTCVLLVGAGLMLRTLANLHRADPGFSTTRTLTASWVLPGAAYAEGAQRSPVIERALDRLGHVPGVSAAALISPLPLSGSGSQRSYYVEGSPLPEPGRQPSAEAFQASGGALAALQIPLVAGRTFGPQDTASSPKVALVDTVFARKHFRGQDPIGKRFCYGAQPAARETDWIQIVGVVGHIENFGLGQKTREQTYVPHTQSVPASFTWLLRTDLAPAALTPPLRAALREVAPDLPVFAVQTMDDLFSSSISTQRLTVVLLGTFAALAVVLAALGLYGVLAYHVGQRTREIGVRMALGATAPSVVALVLRHGLGLAALGLLAGLGASLGLTQLLRSVLFEVSPFDPPSLATVSLLLVAIGGLACWLPARRASRVDPMVALRAE